MRLTSLILALFFCWANSFSQVQQIAVNSAPAPEGYDLEIEVVNEDIGLLVGALGVTDLTGYSCTRLYVTMNNATDFMSSVSGDALNPTYVNTTTNYYHAALGAATPNGINSLLFAVYPDLPFDSWVTIGLEGVPNAAIGEAAIATVQSGANPWATNFDPGFGAPGGNIAIDDAIGGAWYALNGDANGIAGDNLKVLVGQFTTDGDLSGQLYCQVFIEGDGANEFRDTFYFGAGAPVLGCTDATACNYDGAATDDDGSCEFPLDLYGSANLDCDGACLNDSDGDSVCDEDEIGGCDDDTACNYSALATDNDGSCTYPAADNLDCDGNCLNDGDGDGVCDEDEVNGCVDDTACNYSSAATEDDGSCTYAEANLDCDGNCLNDADNDQVCDEDEVAGCTDAGACNYDSSATDDNGSCEFTTCAGCTTSTACNYDNTSTIDDGSCVYADDPCETCNPDGTVNPNDDDDDGVCNDDETEGCTDPAACNDGAYTDTDNSLCEYPIDVYGVDNVDCDGACLNDADNDQVCDEDEIPGCTDDAACNYSASATDENGSCQYPLDIYGIDYVDCDGECLNDADGDGVCNEDETESCTDAAACNYNDDPLADSDNTLCIYASDIYGVDNVDCDGACLNDSDNDLVCDEDEIPGCMDSGANNYDATATDDDGSCTGCTDPIADNYYVGADIDDGSCVISGCTDSEACNYFAQANNENGSCQYPLDLYGTSNVDCDGICLNDADNDGTCDEDEDLDEVLDIINDASGDDLDSTISIISDLVITGGGGSSNSNDAFAGLGIGFVPDMGGQSTGMVATLDLSCSGIEDVTSVRMSGPWWGWDPWGGPEASEVSEGIWQIVFDPAPGDNMEYKWVINGEYEDLLDFGADLLYGDGYDDYLNGACAPITDYYSYANRLWDMNSGDINDTWSQCAACTQAASCGTLFLPTDAAWASAGYNLEALSQEVVGDLLAGHVFLGFCDALENGDQLTNWYGEIFQFSDDGAGNRAIQSLISGDAYSVIDGAYSFDSGSKVYTLGGVIALASADPCLGCTELEMTGSIADYSVECESELDAAMAASDVAAFACSELELDAVYSTKLQFDGRNQSENGGGSSQVWNVLTAGDDANFNNGTDALLQFYDIDGDMGQAVYFVEDLAAGGVTMTQYENGTALLEGSVVDLNDANRGLDIHFYFDNRTAGTAWGGGFKNDYGCAVNTDEWTMYVLNDDMSYATGRGDWQFGTLLRFNHQPSSQYFGYQLGDGANNHNCDANGFSGWFSWSGAIAGEPAYGQAGDIISTLDPTIGYATDCQDGEFVEFHYAAFDDLCNIAQLNIQMVDRDDSTAPTYVSGGADITLDCAISDQWLLDNLAEDETVLFSDNCDDSEYGCAAGFDPNTNGFADGNNVFVCVELVGETTISYTASSCRTLNRTWVATDCFGNQAYHVQTITIEDNTQPEVTVTAPADITLNVNGLCFVDLDPSNTGGTAETTYADNCDLAATGLSYTDNVVDSISTGCYSIIRAWTAIATDSCGNATAVSDNQRIDIQDQIAPSFSYLQVDTIECDLWGDCSYEYLNSIGLATATDNCELSHVDVECTPLSSACTDDYIVDYTAYDMCGNSTSVQQIIVTVDQTAPAFTLAPADLTLECNDASLTGDVDGYAVPVYTPGDGLHAEAMDNCDAEITVTYEDVILTTACDQEYVIRRTYSVYDCDENLGQHIQEITIDDSTAPEFTMFPADVVNVECDAVPAVATIASLGTSDNCDGAPSTTYDGEIRTDGNCADSYTLERTWTSIDCAGNSHTQTQTITVLDTQAPELTMDCPADFPHINECFLGGEDGDASSEASIQMSTDTNGEPTWTVSDNCDADVEVSYTYTDDIVELLGDFYITRTFTVTATDNCGNVTTQECDQSITFTDSDGPLMSEDPAELYPASIACSDMGDPYDVTFMPVSASDGCVSNLTFEVVDAYLTSGSCPGTWVRHWVAYDESGNVSAEEAIQYIPTFDVVAPTVALSCPDNADLTLDADCLADLSPEANGFAEANYSDDCDTNPAVDISYVDGPRTYACGEEVGTYSFTRSWTVTVTDQCGNSSSDACDQMFTVTDNTAPELTLDCPNGANLVNTCWGSLDTSLAALGEVEWVVTDNCDENLDVSYTYSDELEFDCSLVGVDANPEGSYNFVRTFTVTAVDCNGNSTTELCTQTINTFDITAPTIAMMCPDTATVQLDETCSTDVDPSITGNAIANATDDCDSEVTITYSYTDGAPSYTCGTSGYEFIRTWTAAAVDDCGNNSSETCDQLIIVEDNIAPVASITCPEDQTLSADANCEADLSTDALGMAEGSGTDNCDLNVAIEVSYTDGAPTYSCAGDDDQLDGSYSFVRTFTATATDDCGNSHSVTCDQNITVLDDMAPMQTMATLPTDTLYLDLDCAADLTPAMMPGVEAADNCDSDLSVAVSYEDYAPNFDELFGTVDASVEVYQEHTSGDLAGMTTYRVYVVLPDSGDFLSSLSGEGQFSTQLRSTTSFYQDPLGSHLPPLGALVSSGAFPNLEYDSWVTISADTSVGTDIAALGAWPIPFEQGDDLIIDGEFGGALYTLNDTTKTLGVAGADRKVLVAQLTTDGILNGQLFVQYFPQRDGALQQLRTVTIGDGCEGDDANIEGSYVVPRTWQSVVTDDCGNADTSYTYQYIVVLDTIAPQFTNTCDIENGETVEYTCADDNGNGVNDVLDFTELPQACAPAYIENCDSEVALTMTADTMGYVPTGDIANYCMPSDVEALANGETCDDRAPEAIRLFNFSGGEAFTLVDGGSSIVEVMQDSSMHIVLEVENAAGDAGFIFDATYDGAHDWNEWLALPGLHNYKKDCAEIFPGVEIWTEWLYYIMDGGTMSGTGRFAGSEFALQHQPLNAYYGLQIGEGANNKNENYGASAWFFWTGEYVLDGSSQGSMASSGDIFMDLDCCLGWQIDYSYNAVDDCGNSTGFTYTDLGTGTFGNSANSTVSGGHTPVDITAGTSSLKDPIRITGLSPNPTNDISTLGFVVSNNMRLRIDLYTMGGAYVSELFDGNASEEVQYVLDIDATSLSSGMYQIRMSSNDYVLVKKLLVSE